MERNEARRLHIGPLALETPVLLAPMAGYTDLPFRVMVRRLGGIGLAFSEMLNPYSVTMGKGPRIRAMLADSPVDRPLGHQIYGTDLRAMGEAARWLEERGALLIDINMGCPRKEITCSGAGAALLQDPAGAARLAERVAASVSIPVTAKIRLGWSQESRVAVDLARELERVGVAAITVHGRTRDQGFGGQVDMDGIRRVVEAVDRIPVIANGDIVSPEAALQMFQETGCAGIMVGRGATRDPWLIRDLWRELQGLPPLPPPTVAERLALLREHFESSVLHYGNAKIVKIFRRWIPIYAGRLRFGKERMVRLLKIGELSEMRRALGELQANPIPAGHEDR